MLSTVAWRSYSRNPVVKVLNGCRVVRMKDRLDADIDDPVVGRHP